MFKTKSKNVRTEITEYGENFYNNFVNKVAKGRNMAFEAVDAVAQGRIWTGEQALKKGLVDELVNLDDAVNAAADLANITDFKRINYPNFTKDFKDAFKSFPFISSKQILEAEFGKQNVKLYNELKSLMQLQGIQARLPFIMTIK